MSELPKKKYVNSSLERRIQVYPRPLLEKLILGRGAMKGFISKSEMSTDALEHLFFNIFTEKDREIFLREYHKEYPKKK